MQRHTSQLQNSGWMSGLSVREHTQTGNPTLNLFSGWNELHGGSMERNSNSEMGQSEVADRRSRVFQLTHTTTNLHISSQLWPPSLCSFRALRGRRLSCG